MFTRSTKKIFGLAAVAGCAGSYGLWYQNKRRQRPYEFLALDPAEAIENLNNNRLVGVSIKSLEALSHLNTAKCQVLRRDLNNVAWTQLCIFGSPLCKCIISEHERKFGDEAELNDLLKKVEFDDKGWSKAIRWFLSNVCPEDDLRCQDAPELYRPKKRKRLEKVLQVLLYKSEHEDCEQLIAHNVPYILMHVINNYRDEKTKNLIITSMKILSNIASYSRDCAAAIAESEWLSMLAEMVLQPTLPEEPVLAHKVLANMLFSFGASDYRLPSSVYELHRPDPDKEIVMDVIFIHGFRGSLFRTWRQKDDPYNATVRFWPREWLPKDLKDENVRILGLDYASKLLMFGEIIESVEERSKKLASSLETAQVGKRPCVFVVHSMGGLIVKDMLSRHEDLLNKTVGIVFLGVPHRGTPVISAYLNYLRPSHDTKLLQVESKLNRELHERFLERAADKIPLIVNVLEMRKSPLFGSQRLIVPPESATFESGATYHVDEHHYNICKPNDMFSTAYCVVVNFLKDALRMIKQNN